MNKKLMHFILVLLVFNSSFVFGQLSIGIHGGVNFSSPSPQVAFSSGSAIYGYTFSYSNSSTNYYVGIFTPIKLNKYLDLLVDLSYSKVGYQIYREQNEVGGFGVSHTLDYTRIQFLKPQIIFSYGLPLGNGKVSLGAGGFVAFPVSGNVESNWFTHYNNIGDTTYTNDLDSRKMSFGLTGLLRYEFNLGILIEAMYNYQFNAQPGVNLSLFELGVGFTFQFKKRAG